jgi:hypothetical protein
MKIAAIGVNLFLVEPPAIIGRMTLCRAALSRNRDLVGGRYKYYTHCWPVWLYRRRSFRSLDAPFTPLS